MGDDLLRKYAGASGEGGGYTIEEETVVRRGVEEGVDERAGEAAGPVAAEPAKKPGFLERLKALINAD